MNILFVLQRYPGFGGIESVTKMLAGEFINRFGYTVTVFSTSRQTVDSQILDSVKFCYRTSDLKGTEQKVYFDTVVAEAEPDFIIYQDSYIPEEFLLENLPRKCKVIVCEHNSPDCLETGLKYVTDNLSFSNPFNLIRKMRLPFRMRKLHRNVKEHHFRMLDLCDCYLLLSEGFRLILKNDYQMDSYKIRSMPNPIMIPSEPIDFEYRSKQALFVGRLTDQKGINYLVDVWTKIESHCDWNLVVVGDGDKRIYLENEIRLRGLKRMKLVGFQQNTSGYFLRSSVHFMTSIYEGFGITNLEAAIRGTIPFAFDSYASAQDLISNGTSGYLIKPFDVEAYVAAFFSFQKCSQSEITLMRQQAYEKALEFSLSMVADKWNNLFKQLKS